MTKKLRLAVGVALAVCSVLTVQGADRYVSLTGSNVPPYTSWGNAASNNIQVAVDAATNGETVWVGDGSYKLNSTIMISNSITLKSMNGAALTIIDGQSSNRCIQAGVSNQITINGFRIINGNDLGIYLPNGGTIEYCVFTNNYGAYGGAMVIDGQGVIRNCLFAFNGTGHFGGGVAANYMGNPAYTTIVENCTVVSNWSGYYYGGLCLGTSVGKNNIIYHNKAYTELSTSNGACSVNYNTCTVCPNPEAGKGNITSPPIFLDGEFHLASNSPCINKGTNLTWMTNAFDLDGEKRIIGTNVDMGAYEFYTDPDTDGDGLPDWWEQQYFGSPTAADPDADPNYDGRSNFEEYLDGTNPIQLVAMGDRYVSLEGHNQPPFTNWWQASTNIQIAVDAAVNGETIWVGTGSFYRSNGIYVTNGIRISGYYGKSNTYVSASESSPCFTLTHSNAILDELGIKQSGWGVFMYAAARVQNCLIISNNNNGLYNTGIGVHLDNGGIISNCIIRFNRSNAGAGGGVYLNGGGILVNSVISDNRSSTWRGGGGGILSDNGIVRNCLIAKNFVDKANAGGGGVLCRNASIVENCTVVSNTAIFNDGGGGVRDVGGIACENGTIRNSIIYLNSGTTTPNFTNISGTISYCATTPLQTGLGNTASDPFFVNASAGDYRLAVGSPCIDKGTNQTWMASATDLNGYLRVVNGRVDMGAYESPPFTASPMQIWTAVEIGWQSKAGTNYQVQFSTNIATADWINFGSQVLGNGTTNCVFDSTRTDRAKYYRVLVAP